MKTSIGSRQRISVACNACRVKRTKCDGNPHQCSACKYREQKCDYPTTESKRAPPSKAYVKALEARVASLEAKHAQPFTSGQDIPYDTPSALSLISESSNEQNREPIKELTETLGRFNIADGNELRYFGSRSNFSLLRSSMPATVSSYTVRKQGYEAAQRQVGLFTVSRELQDHLLNLYWRWQNAWQYLVLEHLFMRDLKADPDGLSSKFYSPLLLSSINALASRYSDRAEVRFNNDPVTAGDIFANQAKVMLQYEMEAPTTSTIQAIALLSLRETALDKEALGWMYCGMASRMALNLGLHLDCTTCIQEGLLTSEDVEVRNVTWWGCYVLDKLFNIGLGRPAIIQDRDITTKKLEVHGEIENREWSFSAEPSSGTSPLVSHCISNVNSTCELFTTMSDFLDEIYSPTTRWSRRETNERVIQAHLSLVSFYDKLPSFLRISTSSKKPAAAHIYQLHLQYHVVMILLHRPFFKAVHQVDGIVGYGSDMEDIHSKACRASANWITDIFRAYKANYTLRCIPISAVHCAFTAAIIQLADTTSVESELSRKAMYRFKILLSALQDMRTPWAWSTRSVHALYILAKEWNIRIPEELPRSQESSQNNADKDNEHSIDRGETLYSEPSTFNWSHANAGEAEIQWHLDNFLGSQMESQNGMLPGMWNDPNHLPFT